MATVGGRAVFKNINALPRSKRHAAVLDRNGELREGERGADVRRHVVRPLHGVPVEAIVLRNEPAEEDVQIVDDVRIGILLDGERGRGVLDEDGQQTALRVLPIQPLRDFLGNLVETLPAGGDGNPVQELAQMKL